MSPVPLEVRITIFMGFWVLVFLIGRALLRMFNGT